MAVAEDVAAVTTNEINDRDFGDTDFLVLKRAHHESVVLSSDELLVELGELHHEPSKWDRVARVVSGREILLDALQHWEPFPLDGQGVLNQIRVGGHDKGTGDKTLRDGLWRWTYDADNLRNLIAHQGNAVDAVEEDVIVAQDHILGLSNDPLVCDNRGASESGGSNQRMIWIDEHQTSQRSLFLKGKAFEMLNDTARHLNPLHHVVDALPLDLDT